MALPDAESYAQAHADSNYFPCPSCSEPVPRGGSYCPSCGIHCESMIPHRLAGLDAEHEATMKALGAHTYSAGRQPATSAHRRQQMIDRYTQTPGTSGPSLEEAFAVTTACSPPLSAKLTGAMSSCGASCRISSVGR